MAGMSLPESNPSNDSTEMDEWLLLFRSRDDFVPEYARLIREQPVSWGGWPVLKLAIIDRWSESGLAYIKQKAAKCA